MAISYDAGTGVNPSVSSTWTQAHTCAASAWLVVHLFNNASTGVTATGVTYNGAAMTQVKDYTPVRLGKKQYIYVLANPSSGANNVVATWSASCNGTLLINSFLGCNQVSSADASSVADGTTTSPTISVTTVADNCWLVGMHKDDSGGATAGANTTIRASAGAGSGEQSWSTSAAQTPAGSKSLACTQAGITLWDFSAISFAPPPVANHNPDFFAFF